MSRSANLHQPPYNATAEYSDKQDLSSFFFIPGRVRFPDLPRIDYFIDFSWSLPEIDQTVPTNIDIETLCPLSGWTTAIGSGMYCCYDRGLREHNMNEGVIVGTNCRIGRLHLNGIVTWLTWPTRPNAGHLLAPNQILSSLHRAYFHIQCNSHNYYIHFVACAMRFEWLALVGVRIMIIIILISNIHHSPPTSVPWVDRSDNCS